MTGFDRDDPTSSVEYLDALRFVRSLFDDPIEEVPFEWTPDKAMALGLLVIEVLKSTAVALRKTGEAEIDEYVSGTLDSLITQVMATQAGLGDG